MHLKVQKAAIITRMAPIPNTVVEVEEAPKVLIKVGLVVQQGKKVVVHYMGPEAVGQGHRPQTLSVILAGRGVHIHLAAVVPLAQGVTPMEPLGRPVGLVREMGAAVVVETRA